MQVEMITRGARLEELHDSWSALWGRCGAATPFQSPAWLIPWWRVFEPGQLFTIAVWDEADLVALAPLYAEGTGTVQRGLPLGVGCSDYCDILLPDPDEALQDVLCGALAQLGLTRIELPDLGPQAMSLSLSGIRGLERVTVAGEPRPALSLDPDQPWAVVPSGQKRKLRMARHRAERAGGLRIEATEEDRLGTFLEQLDRLHGRRWAQHGEPGVLADPRVKAFHTLTLPSMRQAGLLRAALAWIGEDLVGAYYGFGTASAGYAYLGGFEPASSFASPGTILLGWAIENAVHSGAKKFDFLRGREPYKYRWGAVDCPSYIRRFEARHARP